MIEHIQELENSDDALERHERLGFKERFKDDEHFNRASELLATIELRDKFAMAALTGMCNNLGIINGQTVEALTAVAYDYADGMLKARLGL